MEDKNKAALNEIYGAQRAYKAALKQEPIAFRLRRLERLGEAIAQYEERIKRAIHQDFGKSAVEVEITEIIATLMELKHTIKHLKKWAAPTKVSRSMIFINVKPYIQYEPKGNVLLITPWNYPFQLPMVHLIGAVAAGNTVLLKVSEYCPHINQVLKDLLAEVFEKKHVALVEGEVAETSFMLEKKWDHIHFTGSPAIGKVVMKAAATHLADITLELGGKSPALIDKDVHVEQVVRNIIWAKFVNAGQTCIAPDYMLVDRQLQGPLEEAFRRGVEEAFGQEPQRSADLARIIHSKQFERLEGYLEHARADGSRFIVGGDTAADSRYIAPTVLCPTDMESPLMQEEIFGPILPIVYYDQLEEALSLIAAREKPLALYIFSRNRRYIEHVLAHSTAGGTCVNDAMIHIMQPNLPFGGVNHSGIGQSLGIYGFRSFSHQRAVAEAQLFPLTRFFWFPYTSATTKILQLIRRFM